MTRRAPLRVHHVVDDTASTGTHVVDDAKRALAHIVMNAVASTVHIVYVVDDDDVAITTLLTRDSYSR